MVPYSLATVARLKIVGANFITVVAPEIVDCWSRFNGIRPYSDKLLDSIDYTAEFQAIAFFSCSVQFKSESEIISIIVNLT